MNSRHRSRTSRPLLVTGMLWVVSAVPLSADTVAYYRFENGTADQSFGTDPNRTILDSSGHDFNLTPANNPVASTTVPEDTVPLTGEKNTRSAHFTGTEDIYASPDISLGRVVFTSFTIEAWVNFDTLTDWQTLVGRDDSGSPGEGTGLQSLFYLSKTSDTKPGPDQTPNGLRVELVTRDNRLLTINSTLGVITQTWYHVAVVGDAKSGTLSLYVDSAKVGEATGFTGLFAPKRNNAWTLARGQYKGKALDFLHGYLDEVRFSDKALPPRQFLNAAHGALRPVSATATPSG